MLSEHERFSFAEVDKELRDKIEHHRARMSELGRERANRMHAEVIRRGPGAIPAIAAELGLTRQSIYRLVKESKKHPR